MDLTIVSLVGITTRRAETIVWYYELMTAPSYIHTYKDVQSCKSTRKEFNIHDHKGAYAHAYATVKPKAHNEHNQLQCKPTTTSANQGKRL